MAPRYILSPSLHFQISMLRCSLTILDGCYLLQVRQARLKHRTTPVTSPNNDKVYLGKICQSQVPNRPLSAGHSVVWRHVYPNYHGKKARSHAQLRHIQIQKIRTTASPRCYIYLFMLPWIGSGTSLCSNLSRQLKMAHTPSTYSPGGNSTAGGKNATAIAAAARKAAALKRAHQRVISEEALEHYAIALAGVIILFTIFHWSRFLYSRYASKDVKKSGAMRVQVSAAR